MKKNDYLKGILISLLLVSGILAFSQAENNSKEIIYTTLDLKLDYEIIGIIAAPQDIAAVSGFRGGPVERAYTSAWEKFNKSALDINADAVIGIRIEMENMSGNIVGRLLIYGTAVRFKVETNEAESESETETE